MNRHAFFRLATGLALLTASSLAMPDDLPSRPAHAASAAELTCQFTARQDAVGQVTLHFTLRNAGKRELHLLRWGSPFEGGWFGPFVQASTPQGELHFQGAMRKRGDPSAQDYLHLPPGQTLTAELQLADAFAWPPAAPATAGPLRLKAAWHWHDVMVGGQPPRPRSRHQGLEQDCGELTLGR